MTVTSGARGEGAASISEAIYCLFIFNRDLKQARNMVEICKVWAGAGIVLSVLLCVFQTSQAEADAQPAGPASPDAGSVSPGSAWREVFQRET